MPAERPGKVFSQTKQEIAEHMDMETMGHQLHQAAEYTQQAVEGQAERQAKGQEV
jgi:hypothetical protein